MRNTVTEQQAAQWLREYANGKEPATPHRGLCRVLGSWSISATREPWFREIKRAFERWPEFSGCSDYPVSVSGDPMWEFDYFVREQVSMWDASYHDEPLMQEYCEARLRLCDWLATEIEEGRLSWNI